VRFVGAWGLLVSSITRTSVLRGPMPPRLRAAAWFLLSFWKSAVS
jgi:hypothetical protein